jgi:hypothetical protein
MTIVAQKSVVESGELVGRDGMGWLARWEQWREKIGHKTLDLKHGVVYIGGGGIVSSVRGEAIGKSA